MQPGINYSCQTVHEEFSTLDSIPDAQLYNTDVNYRNFLLIPALVLPFMLAAGNLSAQQEQPAAVVAPADNLQQARQQLQSIQQSLVEKRSQLVQLRQQLTELTDSGEREDLQKQISQ